MPVNLGFGTVTSQGVGSNLDIAGIVDSLMEIERVPLDRVIAQKESFDAKISSLGAIKSSLSTFQTALSPLTSGFGLLANKAESSDTSIVNASGLSGTVAGNYSVEISQLAQSQKLVASGQADATAAIGGGTSTTLTIELGTISGGSFDSGTGTYSGASFTPNAAGSVDIVIDSNNNTLEGIRDAINAADAGVTATIVNDGDATNPYRLVLSSENSGSDQSARISVAGDATLSALLSHDPAGTQNLTENVTAQNALFTVDGISITKPSNQVTDVIDGVTLDLLGQTSGTPVTVSVSQDTDSTKSSIEAFVNSYNDFVDQIRKETDSGVDGGEAGALASDSTTRQMETYLRRVLGQAPTGITGDYTNLSSIGIEFQRDGKLSLDETKLSAAILADSDNVEALFSSADGYGTRLDAAVSEMLAFNGTIDTRTNAFKDRISSLEDRQLTLESSLERTELRLRNQFTQLDVLVANLTATSSFLTQQLEILNAQTSGN